VSTADRAIRASTAAAVLGVAGIAAYVSYWHAFEAVRAHGESGITARLEPATIDGLVYSSSMVVLYAARHRLPVPGLARWLLALGILCTLAANVAHGWSHGPVGAAVAAWPAASLVGSYELVLWLIRTAAAGQVVREPAAVRHDEPAGHHLDELSLLPMPCPDAGELNGSAGEHVMPGGPDCNCASHVSATRQTSGPGVVNTYQPSSHETATGPARSGIGAIGSSEPADVDAAAVATYLASMDSGTPLSERKLAAMFGKTSRRWARNRMSEARQAVERAITEAP